MDFQITLEVILLLLTIGGTMFAMGAFMSKKQDKTICKMTHDLLIKELASISIEVCLLKEQMKHFEHSLQILNRIDSLERTINEHRS